MQPVKRIANPPSTDGLSNPSYMSAAKKSDEECFAAFRCFITVATGHEGRRCRFTQT
jgi:hypothetical protein